MSFALELPRELDSAAAARHAIDDLKLPEELVGDVRLLVSELVTNSLRHASLGPDDRIRLEVAVAAETIRVAVTDRGPGFAIEGRADDPDAVEGWGLYLVATLADRWGVEDVDGSRVWFELDVAGDLDQAA
jgi:anti-sigma regulatory factor (Ser/Thr protein kinase)